MSLNYVSREHATKRTTLARTRICTIMTFASFVDTVTLLLNTPIAPSPPQRKGATDIPLVALQRGFRGPADQRVVQSGGVDSEDGIALDVRRVLSLPRSVDASFFSSSVIPTRQCADEHPESREQHRVHAAPRVTEWRCIPVPLDPCLGRRWAWVYAFVLDPPSVSRASGPLPICCYGCTPTTGPPPGQHATHWIRAMDDGRWRARDLFVCRARARKNDLNLQRTVTRGTSAGAHSLTCSRRRRDDDC